MRIDVHAHYWTGDYLDLLVDLGQDGAGAVRGIGAGGGAELEVRLRLMERAGMPCVIRCMTEIVSSTGAPTIQVRW